MIDRAINFALSARGAAHTAMAAITLGEQPAPRI